MASSPQPLLHGLPASIGPIDQICFITTDIPASCELWARTFGVGPFFHMQHVDLLDVTFRGTPTHIDQSIALGYWHGLQIEFIHQHNETETIFTDWTKGVRHGLHHALVNVPDVEQARKDLAAVGMTAAQEARVGMGGEYIFFDTNIPDLPYLEIIRLDPIFDKLFGYMKRAAREWDGRDAIRDVPPMEEWG